MRTDDLISVMSASSQPIDTGWLRRGTWLAALAALVLTVALLGFTIGVRRNLAGAIVTTPVIAKILFGASIAIIALILFQRSLRPGLKPKRLLPLVAVPVGLVAAWAVLTLALAPAEQWQALIFGRYWRSCLFNVPLYALVPLVALPWLARRGAPVDTTLTGLCAGLAAAGLSVVAYALHCPDDTVPFLATWYTLAIAMVTIFAGLVFPRLLRW